MQNDQKGGERRGKKKSVLLARFFLLILQLRELTNFLQKVVILDCRSARSLGREGNRIVRSFGGKGIRTLVDVRGRE